MKTIKLFLPVVLILLVMSSCGKYEEGPGISVRTKTARVVNKWMVQEASISDSITTANYEGQTYEFDRDETITIGLTILGFSISAPGTWTFNSEKTNILTTYSIDIMGFATTTTINWEILKLKEKEMKVRNIDTEEIIVFVPA